MQGVQRTRVDARVSKGLGFVQGVQRFRVGGGRPKD